MKSLASRSRLDDMAEVADMPPMHVLGRDAKVIVGEGGQPLQHRVDLGLARDEGGKGLIVAGAVAVGGGHRRGPLFLVYSHPMKADPGLHINANPLF
jgi:hypothetical protein